VILLFHQHWWRVGTIPGQVNRASTQESFGNWDSVCGFGSNILLGGWKRWILLI